ncbi:PRKR-interacting protein 1-like [Tubulanus polymorphus]|uniref:PRKR-interacting protein 1-like n=1 Tax=Tubulanus polymorphus TaxID=672921 RepID=UPI003DA53F4A
MADKKDKNVVVPKKIADLQRIKVEKLMKNPDKPVVIPEGPKERTPKPPPEFIRNVWGSSAGAGSGEFHVYRGIRRREYARTKFIEEKAKKEEEDEAYLKKVEENKRNAEEKTAKKRAKRQKKKAKMMANKKLKKNETPSEHNDDNGSEVDESDSCNNENDNQEEVKDKSDQS